MTSFVTWANWDEPRRPRAQACLYPSITLLKTSFTLQVSPQVCRLPLCDGCWPFFPLVLVNARRIRSERRCGPSSAPHFVFHPALVDGVQHQPRTSPAQQSVSTAFLGSSGNLLTHPARSVAGAEAYRRPPPSASGSSNRKARQQAAPDGFRLKTARGALITASLPSLQNLIKRSSESYGEEFAAQWARFGSQVKLVQLGLGGGKSDEENLREVTGFVCQVSCVGGRGRLGRTADSQNCRWRICTRPSPADSRPCCRTSFSRLHPLRRPRPSRPVRPLLVPAAAFSSDPRRARR